MNQSEFEKLQNLHACPETVSIHELKNKSERTLLFGYTNNRDTFHVYVDGLKLHKVIYNHQNEIIFYETGEELKLITIVPDKRLYPEACDFEFCSLLKTKSVSLPFTTFNPSRPLDELFNGKIVWDQQLVG